MFGKVMNMTRCLVVDACGEDREQTTALLQDYGFDVFRAETSEQALSACRTEMPDMIVVAASEEPRETPTLLMNLKAAAQRTGRMPVILVCARDPNPSSIGEAIIHGANEFIVKPFDGAILDDKLKQLGLA